jgi:hypothetical protein
MYVKSTIKYNSFRITVNLPVIAVNHYLENKLKRNARLMSTRYNLYNQICESSTSVDENAAGAAFKLSLSLI